MMLQGLELPTVPPICDATDMAVQPSRQLLSATPASLPFVSHVGHGELEAAAMPFRIFSS